MTQLDVDQVGGQRGADQLADAAVAQVTRWLETARDEGRPDAAADRLTALLRDPDGVGFATRFVDRVLRPDDDRVAGRQLSAAVAGASAPAFLGRVDRLLLRTGAVAATRLPRVVVPLARRRLRQLIGHLLVDADPASLDRHLEVVQDPDAPLRRNINLLGEAVLGEEEADARLAGTLALVRRADVDHVSVKVSSVASQLHPWAFDATRDRVVERLLPLYRAARDSDPATFVNLDMEEHRDLDLTIAVFTTALAREEFRDLSAGVAIQAYLPDSVAAVEELAAFAAERHAAGGAPVRIRLVKGANLAMEHVEAEHRGWAPVPYASKHEVDANYKRLLDQLLTPDTLAGLRLGVASHNLFDVAWAWLLAGERGVRDRVGFEMLEGMAPDLAQVVREDVGGLLLYTPVVAPEDLDAATSYLVRRLEEVSAPQNFLRALPDLADDAVAFRREENRFRRSLADRHEVGTAPRRNQDRNVAPEPTPLDATFVNEPDTDPSLSQNRRWAAGHLAADPGPVEAPLVATTAAVDEVVGRARDAAARWAAVPATERRAVLLRVADALAARRGELLSVMAHEAGKTVGEADPELSEVIDFARYYADRACELETTPGATFTPAGVVVVTPPWNFPVAITLGGALAAIAAGNAVVLKPAPQVERCAEIAVAICHAAGLDADLLQYARVPEDEVGRHLITHDDVDIVVLTGAYETAQRFRSWAPRRRIFAETSGKNALVITPSADLDLAVADLVSSAFGHAGQKCSAASLAILVGEVDARGRLRRQLADATRSLAIGPATDLASTVGPLIGPPEGDLERALSGLDDGERWLVAPEPLDDEGRLWRPGIRDGVRPGSWFHRTECFGPVLGLIDVATLDEAIAVQNAVAYGLTGGIHTLDDEEIEVWCDRVEVGNAYVNRSTSGAIVQRQPFGGWKRSSVGPGAKAGGPDYVAQFGTWHDTDEPGELADVVTGEVARALAAIRPHLDDEEVAWLERATRSDQFAWDRTFSREVDPTALTSESNVHRYRPRPALGIRVAPDAARRAVVRTVLASLRVGRRPRRCSIEPGAVDVTGGGSEVGSALGGPVDAWLRTHVEEVVVEPAADAVAALVAAAGEDARWRLIGTAADPWWEAAAEAGTDVIAGPVLTAGRRELLGFVREQAVSRTMHRYGTPLR